MTRRARGGGRQAGLVAALAIVVLTVSQTVLPAQAAFTTAGTASSGVTTHTLATPVLSCSPGGLLVTTVSLSWPQVSSAATADPYATPPNSSYRADGYEIHRSTGNGSFNLLTSPDRTATTYADSPGGVLTTYHYKIRTKKAGWYSPFSNGVTATVTSVLFVGINTACTVD